MRQANLGGAYLEGAMLPSPVAEKRQPWPSELAKANKGKSAAKDEGKSTGHEKANGHSM
jgi:hypothetical protein